ncbi:hypothetical protein AAY473_032847, partial [Plecturocebus cupreus]
MPTWMSPKCGFKGFWGERRGDTERQNWLAMVGVQWPDNSSLQPQTPKLKPSYHLSLLRMSSHCVAQKLGLKLLTSRVSPFSASQSCSIVGQSLLTATSASRVQAILLPRPPQQLGLQ